MTVALALLLAQAVYSAGPAPCSLVTRSDVMRVLHWSVPPGRPSGYHLPQSSGARCTYEAHEGSVLVVVPNSGSSFLQNNDLVDPFRNGLGTRVPGVGDSAQMFDNTIYLSKHGTSVSIAVLTTNGETTAASLSAFARIAARRMP
ncbi:MAG: hypothetical protein ABSB70_07370 [Candidatus Velthaea sp.]|jgi:hypothetical protein